MGDEDLLYKGYLNLKYGVTLSLYVCLPIKEYFCALTDTGVFTVYANEEQAAATPTAKYVDQLRLGGAKEWNGHTMFSTVDNSFKFVTDKGKEVAASGHNRNEVTLWVKSITAVTDPESKEGQKLAKAKRKQAREREKEQKRQAEYEARARAHRALPKPVEVATVDVPPISYLTDPRRTRLDARNFPKYRQHLQDAKLETRLTAPLDEAKPDVVKKKKKKKRPVEGQGEGHEESGGSIPPPPPPPPTTTTTSTQPPASTAPLDDLSLKFNNLLQLGFSHDEVKNFMAAEGHPVSNLDTISRRLQGHDDSLPGSPLKKAKRGSRRLSAPVMTQPPPPPPPAAAPESKPSFMDRLRSGFRK
ncbi:Aste57867_25362 [Aphanomyces stellatus]|uniref:Aste57867_25362 protein n=1 Tax=Aphanomyces stellatus TaxID=120398 RepID=A0A485LVE3_9STRA|nr:hypothetical protein As57867_025284 [Aphanomyces stellatus]VFU01987.1 Aste57867_25362 [Aphanomyces stellatus]